MSQSYLSGKRICVTGGAGFLGSFVIESLKRRGVNDIFIPRSAEYDLVNGDDVRRMLDDCKPDVVIHLAANVGGIGANREHPAEFFYENLMMGVQLIHESWKRGVEKMVAVGTLRACEENASGPVTGLPAAIRIQFDLSSAGESLRSAG